MKRYTMVMRCGDPKDAAELLFYTLITEDYRFETVPGAKLAKDIAAKKIEVTNLGVTEKGLVSTNGAMKNYTLIDKAGNLVGQPKTVILDRVENEKGLIGYTVYSAAGTLAEINVATAVAMATRGEIANGKIRHTQQGDIVASIGGLYPLRTIKMEASKDGKVTVGVMFIGSAIAGKQSAKYAGIMVNSDSAVQVTELHKKLNNENNKLIEKIQAMNGKADEAIRDSLSIKRTGTAGFYGVYPITTVLDMIGKAENKISLPMGKLMIACTDYDNDKAEANITLSANMKPEGKQDGTDKANKALKSYTESILEKLKGVKIVK